VDEGDARNLAALLRRALRPTPGRLGDSLRIVVVLLIVVAISETFRIPNIALPAYIVLFLSGRQPASTVRTALIIMVLGPRTSNCGPSVCGADRTRHVVVSKNQIPGSLEPGGRQDQSFPSRLSGSPAANGLAAGSRTG
jgi:hypothetical protein